MKLLTYLQKESNMTQPLTFTPEIRKLMGQIIELDIAESLGLVSASQHKELRKDYSRQIYELFAEATLQNYDNDVKEAENELHGTNN